MTDHEKESRKDEAEGEEKKPRSPLRTDSDMLKPLDNVPPDEFPEPLG
ncbi:MAG TPA: hypothetical protein VHD38_01570 [Candidatus Paceibacterota bacterium]|nr:hypothetical protein [Candidatus Paceibacterota bacterium]